MNGVADLESDGCEYVEVDPTGRYGRVGISASIILY